MMKILFGLQYKVEKTIGNFMPIHWIRKVPLEIATQIKLETPKQYTGHSFRRSGASLFTEAGISTENLKHIGRWKMKRFLQVMLKNQTNTREDF